MSIAFCVAFASFYFLYLKHTQTHTHTHPSKTIREQKKEKQGIEIY